MVSLILFIVAAVLFVLAAFVAFGATGRTVRVNFVALGLALCAAAWALQAAGVA
jgi:hypothetical protein